MIKIPKNEGWSGRKYVRYDLFQQIYVYIIAVYEESEMKKRFAFLNGIIKWLLGI